MTHNEYKACRNRLNNKLERVSGHVAGARKTKLSKAWNTLFDRLVDDYAINESIHDDDLRERHYDRCEDEAVDRWRGVND